MTQRNLKFTSINNKQMSDVQQVTDSTSNSKKALYSAFYKKSETKHKGDAGGGKRKKYDILNDYDWTLSKNIERSEIPFVKLTEHRVQENTIKRMVSFYGSGVLGSIEDLGGMSGSENLAGAANAVRNLLTSAGASPGERKLGGIGVYEQLYPDAPTNNTYKLPFFSKQFMSLSTPVWTQPDDVAGAIQQVATGLGGGAASLGLNALGSAFGVFGGVADFAIQAGQTALKTKYPTVSTLDRPRLFSSHNETSINVEFPLFNTISSDAWTKNTDFLSLFMLQNLFEKRDFVTGYPPCFYRVYIPGQYFSYASCVTDFQVENLGNIRVLRDNDKNEVIVPDGYQVKITLTSLLTPSTNQFEQVFSKEGAARIVTVE